ncbi:methylase [Halarchaeum acidiphilum MH1-52-1]|uniref:Methylase n=1 Tax=Halarchaeum acidiphilum MH1-52-1 TaxID=1261545 RepID=U2YWD3_9EURY|nr:methylase [Halarchaeum acidiphilum MH1-52-1]
MPVGAANVGDLTRRVHEDGLTVAFGSPERGLPPMLGLTAEAVREFDSAQSTRAPGGFDVWLNTVPNQGSEVVRTEEAMFASLACLTLTE